MKKRLTLALALVMLLSAFPVFSEAEETELLSIAKIEDDCVWIQTDKGLVPFSKEGFRNMNTYNQIASNAYERDITKGFLKDKITFG